MRNEKVDILRFIGLAMIILAHTSPPLIVSQLRNFDVPLMVIVSAVSFSISYSNEQYLPYLWKRVKRLVLPVWIFLSAYFFLMAATGYPTPLPATRTIISSYFLISGIGYVWVIRVFILVAAIAPLLYKLSRETPSTLKYNVILGTTYLTYELIYFLSPDHSKSTVGLLVDSIFYYITPYAIVFSIGLRLPELSRTVVNRMTACFIAISIAISFALLFSQGDFVPTQNFKYPPTLYYLSYALAISLLSWTYADQLLKAIKNTVFLRFILFVAKNSIWIYLWHIPLIEAVRLPFYLKSPIVFGTASIIVLIQTTFVHHYVLPRVRSIPVKRNINLLFTG